MVIASAGAIQEKNVSLSPFAVIVSPLLTLMLRLVTVILVPPLTVKAARTRRPHRECCRPRE